LRSEIADISELQDLQVDADIVLTSDVSIVATAQSNDLMKYCANRSAPSWVCCLAAAGMTGGFSPGRTLGPVVTGPDGVGEGVGLGDAEGDDTVGELGGGFAAPLSHAATANAATASAPAIPIRMRRSWLTTQTPHLCSNRPVDNS
jgi:hypothetical protein